MNNAETILKAAEAALGMPVSQAAPEALHNALGDAVMQELLPRWNECRKAHLANRRVCYFSMEFLMGRAVYNNLYCLGLLDDMTKAMAQAGPDQTKPNKKTADAVLSYQANAQE